MKYKMEKNGYFFWHRQVVMRSTAFLSSQNLSSRNFVSWLVKQWKLPAKPGREARELRWLLALIYNSGSVSCYMYTYLATILNPINLKSTEAKNFGKIPKFQVETAKLFY